MIETLLSNSCAAPEADSDYAVGSTGLGKNNTNTQELNKPSTNSIEKRNAVIM